jgi:O-antigen ligase
VLVDPLGVDTFTQPKATLVGIAVVVLVACWLAEGLFESRLRFPRTPLDIPLAAYFAWVAVATLFSANVGVSLIGPYKWREGLVYILAYGVIFYAAVIYLRGKALKRALIAGALGAAVVFAYAALQWVGLDVTTWFGSTGARSFSTLGNPLYLGAYTVLIVPIALGMAIAAPKRSNARVAAWGVTALGVLAAAGSFSRGAWLGLLAAMVVMVAVAPARRRVAGWAAGAIVLLVLAAAIPVAGRSGDFASRVASIVSSEGANAPRVELWRGALQLTAKHPLVGVGPEAFKQEFATIKPANWPAIDPEDKSARAHNVLLHIAATTGLPALFAFVAALGLLIGRGLWLLMTSKGREAALGDGQGRDTQRALLGGMLASIVGYVLFLQFAFTMVDVTPLFWLAAGAFVGGTAHLGTGGRWRERRLPALLEQNSFFDASLAITGLLAAVSIWFFLSTSIADMFFAQALKAEGLGNIRVGISYLNTALRLSPGEPYYLFFMGKSFVILADQAGDPQYLDIGVQAYEKALSLDRADTQLLDAIGSAYYTGGTRFGRTDDLARSEFYYKQTLVYDATNPDAVERLGQIAYTRGDLATAIGYFEKAVTLAPSSSAFEYNLGSSYESSGELARAVLAYQKALQLDPANQQAAAALRETQKKLAAPAKKR